MTDTPAARFLALNPTLLTSVGAFRLYEHPTRGDTAPVYMVTPDNLLVNTGFYDLGDFDLALCEELAAEARAKAAEAAENPGTRIKLEGQMGGWQ
jgi:hypothetical protein